MSTETLGRILIADDEETFLSATADLLRREGFQCETAVDGADAARRLEEGEFDLLIADINMPGNKNLDLVHELPKLAMGMPVILATGYPSMTTAIQSVELPVCAYVLKPCEFGELLGKIRGCLDQASTSRAIRETRDRLEGWRHELQKLDDYAGKAHAEPPHLTTSAYLTLAVENIVGSLIDIRELVDGMARRGGHQDLTSLLELRPEVRLQLAATELHTLLDRGEHRSDPDAQALRRGLEKLLLHHAKS
jgi:DNA-binding response OmpR family regulator